MTDRGSEFVLCVSGASCPRGEICERADPRYLADGVRRFRSAVKLDAAKRDGFPCLVQPDRQERMFPEPLRLL